MKENIYDTVKNGDRIRFTGCPTLENGGKLNASLVGRAGTVIQITKDYTGMCLYIAEDYKDGEKQDIKNIGQYVTCMEWQWKDFLEFEKEDKPAPIRLAVGEDYLFENPKLKEFHGITFRTIKEYEEGGKYFYKTEQGHWLEPDILQYCYLIEPEPKNNIKMKQEATYTTLPLASISESPSNPRKSFEDSYLEELAQSIREKGVLQPILVREDPDGADGYEIICGARRYRASLLAGMEEIPAVIRTLTDEEAFELQIIENLQRRDVSPMDEAAAFKRLHDKGNTIKEMALKVGKSDKYVALLLKLNELIEPFQEMLFTDKINLSTAYALCKLHRDFQKDIFNDQCENWKDNSWKDFNHSLKNLAERKSYNLPLAKFDTEDAKLYPKAGACTGCAFNSANQPELFGDGKHICSNALCYQKKTELDFYAKLEKAIQRQERVAKKIADIKAKAGEEVCDE